MSKLKHYYRFATRWMSGDEKLTVIFSPHPDDVLLSLYATMLSGSLGKNILTINIFSTSDSSTQTNTGRGYTGIARVTLARMNEEMRFADMLLAHGINYLPVFCGFKEESLSSYYSLISAEKLGRRSKIDEKRVPQVISIIEGIASQFKNKDNAFLFPLGASHSPDHRLLRLAAERTRPGARIGFYADIPYVHEERLLDVKKLQAVAPKGYRPELTKFKASEKCAVFKKTYGTQFDSSIRKQLEEIADKLGEVIFWSR